MLDIGCYGIVSGRFTFEAEPKRVVSLVDRDPAFGTDRLASVIADFGERAAAQLHRLHAARARTSASRSAAPRGGSRS